ncbi:MAG: hypothetical protein AAGB12_16125 [Pseudomonadota bacterium]
MTPRWLLTTFFLLLSLSVITGCSDLSSGGETTIISPVASEDTNTEEDATPEPEPEPTPEPEPEPAPAPDPIIEVDGVTFLREVIVDPNNAEALPTIQAALDQAQPGDKITIVAGSFEQSETINEASSLKALVLRTSGTADNPILIEGAVTEDLELLTIIDQKKIVADADEPIAGIYLDCVSHVTLRNLRITNVNQAGVTSSLSGCKTEKVTVNNLVVNNISGGQLTSGLRFAHVEALKVFNSHIENVTVDELGYNETFDTRAPSADMNINTLEVSNNRIDGATKGVEVAMTQAMQVDSTLIQKNRIANVEEAVSLSTQAAYQPSITTARVFDNVISQVGEAVKVSANDEFLIQTLIVDNNTIVQSSGESALVFRGVVDANIRNNLFYDYEKLITTHALANEAINFISFWNYNAYWGAKDNIQWTLAKGSPQHERFWADYTQWQHTDLQSQELLNAPDKNSLTDVEPIFINENYELAADSPLLTAGVAGEVIGAKPQE